MKHGILRALRDSRGITQKEFAKSMNVKQQTVASWESGRTEPSNDDLKLMADYFGVTTDYLLGHDTGTPAPVTPDEENLLGLYRRMTKESKQYLSGFLSTIPSFGGGQLAAAR